MKNGKRHLIDTINSLDEATQIMQNHKDELGDPNERSLVLITTFLGELNKNVATVADVLEKINESIKNLATDRNTNPAHADDGK